MSSSSKVTGIDWDAPAFTEAGGKIVPAGSDWIVVLPPYGAMTKSVNTYFIGGVAVDVKGNHSNRSEAQITVLAPQVSNLHSTFSPADSTLPADGKSNQILTLSLKDESNNPVDADVSSIILNKGRLKSAMVSDLVRKYPGVYTVTVTAGTDSEVVTITPSVSGIALTPARVTLTAGGPDGAKSTFHIAHQVIAADGSDAARLTFRALDVNGNPVSGIAGQLTFAATGSSGAADANVTFSSVTESAGHPGLYSATLTGTHADTDRIVPQYAGAPVGSLAGTVTLTAGGPDGAKSTFHIAHQVIAADGSDAARLTFRALDVNGNPVSGIAGQLTFAATGSSGAADANVTFSSVTESAGHPGLYSATLTGTHADTDRIVPQYAGAPVGSLAGTVTLTAGGPDGAKSTFHIAHQVIAADGSDAARLTFRALDVNGNPVSGIAGQLTFAATGSSGAADANVTFSSVTESAGHPGLYSATLTGTHADTDRIVPQYAGAPVGSLAGTVTLTAGGPDGAKSTFHIAHQVIAADGSDAARLTFRALDVNGNPVSGIAGQLTFAATGSSGAADANVTFSSVTESAGHPGLYSATLTGTHADTDRIVPQYAGAPVGSLAGTVTLTAGGPDGAKSTFHIAHQVIAADGSDAARLTFRALDVNGNPVSGIAGQLTFAATGSSGAADANVTFSSVTESAGHPGLYSATLTGTHADTDRIVPQYAGAPVGSLAGTVTLTAGGPDGAKSTFHIAHQVIAADGSDAARLTFRALDVNGNPVSGIAGQLTFAATGSSGAADANVTFSSVTESAGHPGLYSATLTGTHADTDRIVPQYAGAPVGSLAGTVTLTAGGPDGAKSTFHIAHQVIAADGSDAARLTFRALDVNGNPVSGIAGQLTFAATGSSGAADANVTFSSVTESAGHPGLYSATLTGTHADTDRIVPQYAGAPVGSLAGTVTLTAGGPDGAKSTFHIAHQVIAADGSDAARLTFRALDVNGNPVSGIAGQLTFAATGSSGAADANVTFSSVTESAGHPGLYSATLTGTHADTDRIVPQYAGAPVGSLAGTVTLTAGGPDGAKSTFHIAHQVIAADGSDAARLTFRALDVNGNPVSGIAGQLTFAATGSSGAADANVTFSSVTESAGHPGLYSATLTGTHADTDRIVPQYAGAPVGSLAGTVTLNLQLKGFIVGSDEYEFSSDAGFPATGFKGAKFKIDVNNGNASDYTWKSDVDWVSVSSDAVVSFSAGGNTADHVTISGSNSGGKVIVKYEFTLKTWFINNPDNFTLTFDDASAECSRKNGSIPSIFQLTGGSLSANGLRGTLGGLWSEWGNLKYYNAGFDAKFYWMSEADGNNHYLFKVGSGHHYINKIESAFGEICATGG
ncbi:Ig-like domain-containing protein (plasmid) [Pantoea agglomerans]|uniref:Ig-like domain-containing protein n=1 Tax=Enterobacter agglomerans TaxID=549 RepID=UPI002ED103F7|nr:Ig-like domain-containing protein [Pantoea agglomerans]